MSATTNRPNEITTNVTDLIINVSEGQVIFEPDVNLTAGFYWAGLTGFLNNDTELWTNASAQQSLLYTAYMGDLTGNVQVPALNWTSLNMSIDLRTATVFYNATSVNATAGTFTAGMVDDVWVADDGRYYNVTEASGGVPVLTVVVNFSGVTNFNRLVIQGKYEGGGGHFLNIGIMDCADGTYEEEYGSIGLQSAFEHSIIDVADGGLHVCGGLVSVRLNHVQNGVSTHTYSLDYMGLISGLASGANIDHDGTSGRNNFATNHPLYSNEFGVINTNITILWTNASAQEASIYGQTNINTMIFNNFTYVYGNISQLQSVKASYESDKVCPAGQFMNGTNTTNIACGAVTIPTYYDDRWSSSSLYLITNGSNGGGNVYVSGNNITFNPVNQLAKIVFNYTLTLTADQVDRSVLLNFRPGLNSSLDCAWLVYRSGAGAPGMYFYCPTAASQVLVPNGNAQYDLGKTGSRWRSGYISNAWVVGDMFYDKNPQYLIREIERPDGLYRQFIPRRLLTFHPEKEVDGILTGANWGTAEEWMAIGDTNWNTTRKIHMSYDGDIFDGDGQSLRDLRERLNQSQTRLDRLCAKWPLVC